MWTSKFRSPALQWATKHTRALATAPGRGPRNSLRRREFPQPISNLRNNPSRDNAADASGPSSTRSATENTSSTLHDTPPEQNTLLAPVHIPEDPNAVLKERHPAARLLANSGLVVQRELELMNVMLYVFFFVTLSLERSSMKFLANGNRLTADSSKQIDMSLWTRTDITSGTWQSKTPELAG